MLNVSCLMLCCYDPKNTSSSCLDKNIAWIYTQDKFKVIHVVNVNQVKVINKTGTLIDLSVVVFKGQDLFVTCIIIANIL